MVQSNIQNTREVLVSVVDFLIKWWDIIISMQTAILSWERQCMQYSCASGKFLWFTASLLFFLLPILADHTWLCSFILSNDKKVEQNWVASCGFCFPDEQGRVISEARKSSSCENIFFKRNGADVCCVLSTSDGAQHHPIVGEVWSAPYAGLDLTSSGFSSHGILFL